MLKVGIIGCFDETEKEHIKAYKKINFATLIGINKLEEKKPGCCSNCVDLPQISVNELINKADVIDICLPVEDRLTVAKKAAAAGKDIICEIPLSENMEEAERLVSFCRDCGVRLIPLHKRGLTGPLAGIREKLKTGQLEKRGMIRINRFKQIYPSYHVQGTGVKKMSKVILNLLIDDIAFLLQYIGPVERVFTRSTIYGNNRNTIDNKSSIYNNGNNEYVLISLRFKNGTIAHLNGSLLQDGEESFEFAGKSGLITYLEGPSSPLKITLNNRTGRYKRFESPLNESRYELALKKACGVLLDRDRPHVLMENSLKALQVTLGAVESAAAGRPVTFSSDKEG